MTRQIGQYPSLPPLFLFYLHPSVIIYHLNSYKYAFNQFISSTNFLKCFSEKFISFWLNKIQNCAKVIYLWKLDHATPLVQNHTEKISFVAIVCQDKWEIGIYAAIVHPSQFGNSQLFRTVWDQSKGRIKLPEPIYICLVWFSYFCSSVQVWTDSKPNCGNTIGVAYLTTSWLKVSCPYPTPYWLIFLIYYLSDINIYALLTAP